MLDKLIALVAPHHCCGCDRVGSLLCDNCKYNIINEPKVTCLVCQKPTAKVWLCDSCRPGYERAWAVGVRDGVLQRLIGLYKFERARGGYRQLSELLSFSVPELPDNVIVVPVPTVSSHIRERGYDHVALIAKDFAKRRGLPYSSLIQRVDSSKQRQASATERLKQASRAFVVDGPIDVDAIYLVIDDVVTTGATIKYATKALRDAGARHIWVAVVARQALL